jgi:hypothetical protein
MNEEGYGRDRSVTSNAPANGRIERADAIDVVKNVEAQPAARTVTPAGPLPDRGIQQPPTAPSAAEAGRSRSHLRAVERPGGAEHGRVANAVETVGAAVGWTTGYVRTRQPAAIRSDAEKLLVASPALALVAAVGFGYLVGSFIRR